MEAIGIKKVSTYTKHLKDLIDWGFIEMIQESKNQYTSSVVSIVHAEPKKGSALGSARSRQGDGHGNGTGFGKGTIDKPSNIEPLNLKPFNGDDKKNPKKPKQPNPLDGNQDLLEHQPLTQTTVAGVDVATLISDSELVESIIGFFEYRKSSNAKITSHTVNAIVRLCKKMSPENAMTAIDVAMSGGHASIIPITSTPKGIMSKEHPQEVSIPQNGDYIV